jgi:hypothetical protein
MSFGLQVINELTKRHELGMYFDYAGYRALRNIENANALSVFLKERGYSNPPELTDAVAVANWLRTAVPLEADKNFVWWWAFDPLGGLLMLPLWLLFRSIVRLHNSRWAFSLRTLLIATTIIALLLGLVVWSSS